MSGAATMNSSMQGEKTLAGALALAMHALFIVLLIFGVSWQKKYEPPAQADLWSSLPPIAPPKVTPVTPPQPVPEPPKPAPKVDPKPVIKPDIAFKKKEVEKKKPEPVKTEPRKVDDDKAEKARRAKEAEATKQREEAARRDLDLIRKEREADAANAAKAQATADARAAAAREIAKYVAGIRSRVYAYVPAPDGVQGNPEAVVSVTLLPGGELLDARLVRGSGNAEHDQAVLAAIRRAQPFVVPTGDLFDQHFRRFTMSFRPRP